MPFLLCPLCGVRDRYDGAEHHKICLQVESAAYSAIVLHLVNHILKAYFIVQRHNHRMSKAAAKAKAKVKAKRMQKALKIAGVDKTKAQSNKSKSNNISSEETDSSSDEDEESSGDENDDEDGRENSDTSQKEGNTSNRKDTLKSESSDSYDEDEGTEKEYKDQGFTRAKVLVIAPMRCDAARFVHTLRSLLPPGHAIPGVERFTQDFEVDSDESGDDLEEDNGGGQDQDQDQGDGEEGDFLSSEDGSKKEEPQSNRKRKEAEKKKKKPKAEWQEVFTGNADDDFLLGISVRRRGIKLFAGLYSCDIIVASPLGLRRKVRTVNNVMQSGTCSRGCCGCS